MNAKYKKLLLTLGLSSVVMFSMARSLTAINPLLHPSSLLFGAPDFSKIKTEYYLPALRQGIATQRKAINAIVVNKQKPTFANTILAYENSGKLLDRVSSVFYCLTSADKTPEIAAIEKTITPELTKLGNDISFNLSASSMFTTMNIQGLKVKTNAFWRRPTKTSCAVGHFSQKRKKSGWS